MTHQSLPQRFLNDGIWSLNAPVKAVTEWDFCQRVEALWTKYAGTARSYVFPKVATSPQCVVAADDTETLFKMIDGTEDPEMEIPWFAQDSFDRILACVVMATPGAFDGLEARITTKALVTGADPVSSPWFPVVAYAQGVPMADFRATTPGLHMLAVTITHAPTLPADRRVAIRLGLRNTLSGVSTKDLVADRTVYLASAHIRDQISSIGG